MKKHISLIIISISIFLASCHNDNPTVITGDLRILSVSSDSLSIGDTLVINGEFMGIPDSKKNILLEPQININSTQCFRWNNNNIIVIIPPKTQTGYLKINENGNTLDSIFISVSPVPFFDVLEIPAGKFLRGSINSDQNEQPIREITISKPFLIGKFEITQRIYESVMGNNPSIPVSVMLPVVNVSWGDAIQFCNNLSKIHGLTPFYIITGADVLTKADANGWRLPTEAEWEYACRAGSTGDFAGSGIIDDFGWYADNSGLKLHPPGSKKANSFGLYDMHGNCREWCWDFFSPTYYSISPVVDPKGPSDGLNHVLRGGSWLDGKNILRSSNRLTPDNTINNVGFRIVRYF